MTLEDGFGGNNSMNSFNHYAFGSVTNWLMQRSLGIARDEAHPGFQHFLLTPLVDPTGSLRYAKGHYDSLYGRIESGWERQERGFRYRFVVPANTSATLHLPAKSLKAVRMDGKRLPKSAKLANGEVELEMMAGTYTFEVTE